MGYVKLALIAKDHWKEILYFFLGIFALMLIGPLFSSIASVPNADESDIQKYVDVASELGLDWRDLAYFDMVLHGHNLKGVDPNESAYYFLQLKYEEFTPAQIKCVKEENGKCIKTETIPEKVTYSKTYKGKKSIQSFFQKQGLRGNDINKNINAINDKQGKRVIVTVLSVDEAEKLAGFTKAQKQEFEDLKASGILDQLFPSFANMGTNIGAVCSASGKLDEGRFNAVLAKAGVLASKGNVIKQVAKEEGIDPVIMLAIMIQETGWGKSTAIVEHNNPAGLMQGSTIITYSTLDAGIKAQGVTLNHLIIGRGLTTIEKLGSVYAPVGASNDPYGQNKDWVPGVTALVKQLGGLTMNCTPSDNAPISVGANGQMSYFSQVMNIMLQFKGQPYVWGGNSPSQGFDCSGLMQYSFGRIGIKLPRTAHEQYDATKRIPASEAKAGDLVFFRGTYGSPSYISHVGIYVGNGKMYNSNGSGIGYSDITTGYSQ